MGIQEDVKWIENLAKIELTEEEKKRLGKQLVDILQYFKKLEELDTANVEPMKHVLEVKNVLREDESFPPISPGNALKNAPKRRDDYFQVPKMM